MIKEHAGSHMIWVTGYALLMLFVSIYGNSVIHWAVVAHSFHIFSLIVRRIALHYTDVRLASWLLQVPHSPYSCIAYKTSVELNAHIWKDVWFWFSEKWSDSVLTCITWYNAYHVFVCYGYCYDYSQYMLKRKKKKSHRKWHHSLDATVVVSELGCYKLACNLSWACINALICMF